MVTLSVAFPCQNDSDILKPLEGSRQRTLEGIRYCIQRGIDNGELINNEETLALAACFDSFLMGISTLARDDVPLEEVLLSITQIMKLWDSARL